MLWCILQYIVEVYGKPEGKNLMGLFYGGHGQLLLCQFIAMVVIAGWSSESSTAPHLIMCLIHHVHIGAYMVDSDVEKHDFYELSCGGVSSHA